MHVKHANLLGKVTRLSVGALLATQLSACSALGMKTPGEMWKGATAEREPQMIDGPRRLPLLNKELLQATQSGQQPKVEHLLEQDKRAASGIYVPAESGLSPTEPAAKPRMQSGEPAIEMRDPGANAPRSDVMPGDEPSEFTAFVNRIGNLFSSADAPAVADANPVSEPAIENDTQVSMKNAASISNLAVQSAVSNSVAVPSNSAAYRPARKPISGNPVQFYAAPGAKLDAANHKEVLEDAPKNSIAKPANPRSGKEVSMKDAPVALRPEMNAEIVEDNHLFHQSLALSSTPPMPLPQENAPSAKAVLPATGTREEKEKTVEPLVSSKSQILPTVDPNSNDPYPPLSSVPQTPTRLGEAKAEGAELLNELKNEGDTSAEKRAETEQQAEEEASESLKNMPAQEIPAMPVETPGEAAEPLSAPTSLNDSDDIQPTGQAYATIAPAAGNGEQLLGHMGDAAGNQELRADEKAAVNVLDSSLASPNTEQAAPVEVKAGNDKGEVPVKAPETVANTKDSDAPKQAARFKKHVTKKAKASKPAEPRLSKPLDYSTVKPLMLPESYTEDANTTANIINENKAASQSPSVETLLSVDGALNQRNALAPAELTQATPTLSQPEQLMSQQVRSIAQPAISGNESVVLASGIVLPPAQFTQPIATLDTSTPMPTQPPLAPVAANEFLLNRIVRQFVGIFSVAPNYVYLPVLNENRTVRYLPDSRYMQP